MTEFFNQSIGVDEMNESNESNVLELKFNKSPLVKGDKRTEEKNSKGDLVSWTRLEEKEKKELDIVTAIKNHEFGIKTKLDLSLDWLKENEELGNVQEFLTSLFVDVNRKLIAKAVEEGKKEVEYLGDLESLVAFSTLESKRGRKKEKFDSEMWKSVSSLFSLCLRNYFKSKKVKEENLKGLVGKYLNIFKGVLCHLIPVDKDTEKKLESMLGFIFEETIEKFPMEEEKIAFAISILEKLKESNEEIEEDF